MCGIAGALGRVPPAAVTSMMDAIRHRGPDDHGLLSVCDARGIAAGALGHRRLAILDLTAAGHQPMLAHDGALSMVFNGEIYNYAALRQSLLDAGARFRGTGDSEVLLEGWAKEGPAFLARMRGMYAFVIWEERSGSGWLVRDPLGIKPLYVAEADGAVLFASELRALLASGMVERRLDRKAVAAYLAYGSVPEPLTLVASVRALPAGTVTRIHLRADGGAMLEDPVEFAGDLFELPANLEDDPVVAAMRIREVLRESVRLHMVSDVPVGLFLSGGIDSSAVVALASEVASEPLTTFTVTFDEAGFSEAGPARIVASRFGTRHQEIPLSGERLLQALPHAFAAMDQPSMDGLNTYVVSGAVREHGLKVVLSGLGGDEMFAGYPSFSRARALTRLWPSSRMARRALSAAIELGGGVRAQKLALMLSQPSPATAAYRGSRALFGDRHVHALVGCSPPGDVASPPHGSTLQQVTWLEATGYMRNTLLRDSDVFSMAHGLELRVPFVDVEVVKAVNAISDRVKSLGRVTKPLLVSALSDLLPAAVWDRPKQGFTLPFAIWLRGALRDAVHAELSGPGVASVGLDPLAVKEIWNGFVSGGAIGWSRPWALYTLVRWAHAHGLTMAGEACRPAPQPPGAVERLATS